MSNFPFSVAFSPDGQTLARGSGDNTANTTGVVPSSEPTQATRKVIHPNRGC